MVLEPAVDPKQQSSDSDSDSDKEENPEEESKEAGRQNGGFGEECFDEVKVCTKNAAFVRYREDEGFFLHYAT